MSQVRVLDLDDVSLDFNTAINKYLERTINKKFRREEYTSFGLHETWKCEKHEALRRVLDFYESPEFQHMTTFTEILPILNHYKDQKIIVVTSRPPIARKITEIHVKRLEGLGSVKIEDLILSGWGAESKPEICKRLNARTIIDDCKENIEGCIGIVPELYMPAQPWNHGTNGEIIRGTHSEIYEKIKQR